MNLDICLVLKWDSFPGKKGHTFIFIALGQDEENDGTGIKPTKSVIGEAWVESINDDDWINDLHHATTYDVWTISTLLFEIGLG